jgi:hypothetical protein
LRHVAEFRRGIADHDGVGMASTSSMLDTIRREMCGMWFRM